MTREEYDAKLSKQDGGCFLCSATKSRRGNKHFCVDHDHKTGLVRALLCHRCNTAIGLFGENVELLKLAIQYLEKYAEK